MHHRIVTLAFCFSFVCALSLAFPRVTNASLYAPGATLDPACAPTDLNCGIESVIASSTANGIPYYATSGGILSATSSLAILPSGNIGIGTTSPAQLLSVGGSVYISGALMLGSALAILDGGTGTSTAPIYGQLVVGDASGSYEFTSTSTLGINFASIIGSTSILQGGTGTTTGGVSNGIEYFDGSDLTNGTQLTWNGSLLGVAGNASSTQLTTSGTTYLATAGGNVGIGTTSPSALLTLDSPLTTGTDLRMSNTSVGGHVYDFLETGSANTGGAGRLDFFDKTVGAARLSIAANGNIGVGTTSPYSSFSVQNNYGSNSSALFSISSSTTSNGSAATTFLSVSSSGNVWVGTSSPTSTVTVPNLYSYPAKFIIQGNTSDLSAYSLATVDSTGRLTSDIDNNGRMDLNNYSGVGGVFDLRNYASSTNNEIVGHYAYTANDSDNNPSTVAYLLAELTNTTETSMSSELKLNFMNNVNTAPGGIYTYSQPNDSVTISSAGLDLPNIPITNVTTGILNLGNGLYVSSPGLVSIGSSSPAYPLLVHIATNQNVRFRSNTNEAIESVNDAANAFVPLQIDASSLLLNSATGGNVGIGTTSPVSKLEVTGNSTGVGVGGGQFIINGSTNPNQRLALGYDTSYNYGWLQAGFLNTAYEPLLLDPVGGNVSVGTTTSYARLEVWGTDSGATTTAFAVINNASTTAFAVYDNGNATYSGSIFQSSDQRLKTDVTPLDASSSLAEIEGLSPVSYTRIDQPGQGTNLGFIAQAVQPRSRPMARSR
jgi:hypothetical protein